jgi:hypothetical protein
MRNDRKTVSLRQKMFEPGWPRETSAGILVLQCYKTKSLAESASWDKLSELMQVERGMLQPAQTLVKMTTSRSDLGFVTL